MSFKLISILDSELFYKSVLILLLLVLSLVRWIKIYETILKLFYKGYKLANISNIAISIYKILYSSSII
jgi:hypothetical protein